MSERTPDRYLATDHLIGDLRGLVVRNGIVAFSTRIVRTIIMVAATAVLARILTPEDFGIVAIGMVFASLAYLFADSGLSTATINKKDLTAGEVCGLFWINLGLGIFAAFVISALAPLIAWLYSDSRLVGATIWLSLTVALNLAFIQHRALMVRQMQWGKIRSIEIGSISAGCLVGIIAAFLGASYWALVAMHITGASVSLISFWIVCGWRPAFTIPFRELRESLAFGGNLMAVTFLQYTSRQLDSLLVGWMWGITTLGYYNRAYQLLILPVSQLTQPLSGVIVPAMSRLRDDPVRWKTMYLNAMGALCFLMAPMGVALILFSRETILLLLGSQWQPAIPIFRLLAISLLVQPILVTTAWIYISQGNTRRMFKWSLIETPVIVGSFIVGLPFGAEGVAFAYSLAVVALAVPSLLYAFTGTNLALLDVGKTVWRQFFGAAVAAALSWLCLLYLAPESTLTRLILGLMVFGLTYITVMIGGLGFLPHLQSLMRDLSSNNTNG